MPEVALVLMPFAAPQRPSIALGLLKSALRDQGIEARVHYANLWYIEAVSLAAFMRVECNRVENLLGEWVFASAAFPDFHPDPEALMKMTPRAAEEEGFSALVAELRELSPDFVDLVARRILGQSPRVVACSSMFQQHCASLALLRRVRELDDTVVTVLGGANCEGPMGRATHRAFPWVDFVVNGEAEVVFPQLCAEILASGREMETRLPGVLAPWHRRLETPPEPERLVIDRLDESPTPDYEDYFASLKSSSLGPLIAPGLLIETSRGCWWGQKHHCTFCGLNGTGMGYRSKSAERILEEFQSLARDYETQQFAVVDNIINLAHLKTVLPALPAGFKLFYETKANLRCEQVEGMAEAGVRWIQPGIESMHDEVLKLMDKGTTALINVQLLKWAREHGVQVTWNLLMGFPGEEPAWYEEMADWLPLIAHLPPPMGAGFVRYDRFSPYHTAPERYGIELSPCRSYSFVYPVEVENLAYFFEDQPDSTRRLERSRGGTGHQATQEQIRAWRRLSERPIPPILSLDDDGLQLFLIDTRPCAVTRRHTLEGLAREVYLACDQARSLRSLPQVEGLETVLADLVERRLMLAIDGKYLALAVRGALPPMPERFPGGDVLEIPKPPLSPREGLEALERSESCLK